VEAGSYKNIAATLGVDLPSEILFATDVLAEAQAAKEAGWRAVLVVRPGNEPLPQGQPFAIVHSLDELLSA
jgi:methylthioribulose 1-phosphate dehydratase / enolase-phosphatase E1